MSKVVFILNVFFVVASCTSKEKTEKRLYDSSSLTLSSVLLLEMSYFKSMSHGLFRKQIFSLEPDYS